MEITNLVTRQEVEPQEWQRALAVGDCYVIERAGGWVGSPEEGWEAVSGPGKVYGQLESDEDCDEGFFWTTAYSAYCPEGDGGLVCVCDVTGRITAEEFEQARQRGWNDV